MKRAAELLIVVWFLLQATDGALRYLCAVAGVPFLVYAKDTILLAIFAYFVLLTIARFAANRTLMILLVLLFFGLIVGIANGLSFGQVAFGAKIYLPFLVGFMAMLLLEVKQSSFSRLFHIVVPVILLGLVLDLVITVPWSGFAYELAGTSIEGSRQWGTFGLSRLAGFGRSSFGTATDLYVIVMLYLVSISSGLISRTRLVRVVDVLLMILATIGIIVTTSKSTIFAILILLIVYGLVRAARSRLKNAIRVGVKILLLFLLLYGILPPIVSLISPSFITDHLQSDNLIVNALSLSYIDRMENMWPAAYDLMRSGVMFLTGRGLGGIGTAQLYFELPAYNSADNVYLYLFVQFGLIVLVGFVIWLLVRIFRLNAARADRLVPTFFLLSLLAFGATMNVVESSPLTMSLGMLLAIEQREPRDDR